MFVQLSLAGCVIAVTVTVQALFMSIGLNAMKHMGERHSETFGRWPTAVVVLWVLFLLVPIVLDVVAWACLYRLTDALPNFEDALYFSAVTFTTVGYGDIVLEKEARVLATFEAVNGWIIFGWATALVMIVIQRLFLPGLPR